MTRKLRVRSGLSAAKWNCGGRSWDTWQTSLPYRISTRAAAGNFAPLRTDRSPGRWGGKEAKLTVKCLPASLLVVPRHKVWQAADRLHLALTTFVSSTEQVARLSRSLHGLGRWLGLNANHNKGHCNEEGIGGDSQSNLETGWDGRWDAIASEYQEVEGHRYHAKGKWIMNRTRCRPGIRPKHLTSWADIKRHV